ncbi:MAG: ECF transporter S component [Clostridia bacterium]|nr:ECF transporter S component [Clostridia bacterium]
MTSTQRKIYKVTLTAMLSAIAFALMFIEFPVPVMPSFIKFDISDLPPLFASFALGPVYGVIAELIKNILHIIVKGTTSAGVGELSNFLLGAVFCLVAGFIYKSDKNKKRAVIGCIAGALAMGIICLPINYFIVYPAYVKFYMMPLEATIGMYQAILGPVATIPTKNALFNCLLIFNAPFTFIKGLVDALICILIYKPLSVVIKKKM